MARMVALAVLVAALAVAEASSVNKGKGVSINFSKSGKGAAVAAAPVVKAEAPAPAPCKEVCQDKCYTKYEESCQMVPVTTQECAMVKVVNTVKQCKKMCTTTTVTPTHAPAMAAHPTATTPEAPAPMAANPSAMPQAAGDVTVDAGAEGQTVSVTVDGGEGRKMLSFKKKSFLPLLLAGKGKGVQVAKQQQHVECKDVCEDVPVEGMEKQCKDVTSEKEECTKVPKTTCEKECGCAPTAGKGKSFMLPMISISKGKGRK